MITNPKTLSTSNKLINFNAPNYLINHFDEMVRFRGVSRTSTLIRLMENYLNSEFDRLRDDDKINQLIQSVKLRNHQQPSKMKKVQEDPADEANALPPVLFSSSDDYDWETRFSDIG